VEELVEVLLGQVEDAGTKDQGIGGGGGSRTARRDARLVALQGWGMRIVVGFHQRMDAMVGGEDGGRVCQWLCRVGGDGGGGGNVYEREDRSKGHYFITDDGLVVDMDMDRNKRHVFLVIKFPSCRLHTVAGGWPTFLLLCVL